MRIHGHDPHRLARPPLRAALPARAAAVRGTERGSPHGGAVAGRLPPPSPRACGRRRRCRDAEEALAAVAQGSHRRVQEHRPPLPQPQPRPAAGVPPPLLCRPDGATRGAGRALGVLLVAARTPSLDADVKALGFAWKDLCDGYWELAGG